MPDLIFEEGAYRLRRMEDCEDEYARLSCWLTDDRVLLFYEGRDNPFPVEKVRQKYAPRVLSAEGVIPCFMVYEGRPAGYLQFYRVDDPCADYSFDEHGLTYALDLFIGDPDLWGRGIGTQFIRLLLCYLFEQKGASWVLIDPHVDNARAIRAYEKCNFRKIKILPAHEQHEGRMVDCWLMGVQNPDLSG